MRNFKVEKNGTIRDDRGMRVGTVDKNYLRDSRGLRIAEISNNFIRDSRGIRIGEVSGTRIRDRLGSTVGDISKIPLDYEMPVSPAMAAAIQHFFIKPILLK